MINWNKYFDHIYVISRCKNFDRRNHIDYIFDKIGITNYTYWYVPDFNFKDSKIFKENKYITKESRRRCAFGHFSCWKCLYELDYDNILIVEDDASILYNEESIQEILDEFEQKKDISDIYMFDNIFYSGDDFANLYYIGTMYYCNRKGLDYLIRQHEKYNIMNDLYFYDFEKTRNSELNFIKVEWDLHLGDYKYIHQSFNLEDISMLLNRSSRPLALQKDKALSDVNAKNSYRNINLDDYE